MCTIIDNPASENNPCLLLSLIHNDSVPQVELAWLFEDAIESAFAVHAAHKAITAAHFRSSTALQELEGYQFRVRLSLSEIWVMWLRRVQVVPLASWLCAVDSCWQLQTGSRLCVHCRIVARCSIWWVHHTGEISS